MGMGMREKVAVAAFNLGIIGVIIGGNDYQSHFYPQSGPYENGYYAGQSDAVYDHDNNLQYNPVGQCLPCHSQLYWQGFRGGYDSEWNSYQSRGPTRTTPPQIVTPPPAGNIFYPFHPESASYHGQTKVDGCYNVNLRSGGTTRSCRWVAKHSEMISNIGENGYRIDVVADIGNKDSDKNQEFSITSGGTGSTDKNCCGFTCRTR